MSTKICTSIEQSKKLLSLGLDPSTADMHLINGKNAGCVPYMEIIKYNNPILDAVKIQPCWSLTALLELMPNSFDNSYKNVGWFDNAWWCGYTDEDSCTNEGILASNPLDAAFKMVCSLLEQRHIKVNK